MTSVCTSQTRVLLRADAEVGEGPVVSADGRTVYWVDIFAGVVHTTGVSSGLTSSVQVDTLVGAVAIRRAGGFVAATREGFATIDLDGRLDTRLSVLNAGIRMNDGACDSAGRFWAGSTAMNFAPGQGALHVLLPDWTTTCVLDGLTQPNGLGWSPDDTTFYLVDSARHTLSAYDSDPRTGELSHGRVLREFPLTSGAPDGLTVDSGGDLWVALWGGSQIVRLSAAGDVVQTVELPVRQPTSCAFAGPERDVLVVTSATQGLDISLESDPLDGALLCVVGLDAHGLPTKTFAG